MPPKLRKGQVVLRLTDDKTGRSGEVRLDKARGEFFSEVRLEDGQLREHTSKDMHDVKGWLRGELAKAAEDQQLLTWQPVAVVHMTKGADRYHTGEDKLEANVGVGLMLERFYLGLTSDQREWRMLTWAEGTTGKPGCIPVERRFSQSKRWAKGPGEKNFTQDARGNMEKVFLLPSSKEGGFGDRGSTTYYVAWTPELWRGLLEVARTIKQAHEVIADIVGSDSGMAMLVEVGAGKIPLQLNAGSKK